MVLIDRFITRAVDKYARERYKYPQGMSRILRRGNINDRI
jgi:hypothetical protein